MGYGAVLSIAGSAIGGAASAAGHGGTDLSGYNSLPSTPDLENNYLEGFWKQVGITPDLLDYENRLRNIYGRRNAQTGADIYSQVLPTYANANLRSLNRVDPEFMQGRKQLYGTLSQDLGYGSELTPDMQSQLQQYVRGGQAARGNLLGNAPISTEAFAQGASGQGLKEQRISNMQRFLAGPGPEDKFGGLAGAGSGALTNTIANLSGPGYKYMPDIGNLAQVYYNAAQTEFQDSSSQALARAGAIAGAQPAGNPFLGALSGAAGGLSGLSGAFGGGGGSGGSNSALGYQSYGSGPTDFTVKQPGYGGY